MINNRKFTKHPTYKIAGYISEILENLGTEFTVHEITKEEDESLHCEGHFAGKINIGDSTIFIKVDLNGEKVSMNEFHLGAHPGTRRFRSGHETEVTIETYEIDDKPKDTEESLEINELINRKLSRYLWGTSG